MRFSVDFDDQHAADMGEVGGIRADRVLAAEFAAVAVGFAEPGPEDGFGFGHFVPHRFGAWPRISFVIPHALTRNRFAISTSPASGRGYQVAAAASFFDLSRSISQTIRTLTS
jgi:hypothetical protein